MCCLILLIGQLGGLFGWQNLLSHECYCFLQDQLLLFALNPMDVVMTIPPAFFDDDDDDDDDHSVFLS